MNATRQLEHFEGMCTKLEDCYHDASLRVPNTSSPLVLMWGDSHYTIGSKGKARVKVNLSVQFVRLKPYTMNQPIAEAS